MVASSLFDVAGRVVWIPGGGGHLGSVISRGLIELGARVVVGGRDGGKMSQTVNQLREEGLQCFSSIVDVGDQESVNSAVDSIMREHGLIDACINLATFSTGKSSSSMSASEWESGLRVTATGAFLVARACGAVMQTGASIVQFSSMYGNVSPDPRAYPTGTAVNPIDYGFAKAGVQQLVRYQAVEFAPKGIRVNAIAPGPFPDATAVSNREFLRNLEARVPLGRTGRAEELLGAVILLCSDASSYMTGTTVTVDGGWTAW